MARSRSRTKHVSYVLQVTCDKTPADNEREFLLRVRSALAAREIYLDGNGPKVSVVKRIETFRTLAEEK